MNLTRALEVALPDIPARALAERCPRIAPGTNFREHIEDGRPVIRVYVPSANCMYKFPPANWQLAQLFDGKRSYEEIADLYSREIGAQYDPQDVRDFAADLEAIEFWYKTPQEKNIQQIQQAVEQRRNKVKQRSRWADLSMVMFPAFNPDRFLTVLYHHTRFIYTAWFTVLTLICFAFTAGITITHWDEIGRDTKEFYNFSNKSWGDIFILYALIFAVVIIHEFAHAYVSKHFGGRVTSMGFALIYLTPALFTDTTEAEVMSSRYERLVVTVAGVWSELMVCAVATFIWWGTPPDTPLHNGAYFIMMITGLISILVNWNPLMKLDGYYILCDMLDLIQLKENSTAFVSAWVKKYIWRLPVEVPYVPRRRRAGYAVYAILSGAYSYMILYVVARFAGNIVRNFSPEWGFIPEILVALLIFRSRIRLLGNFMKFLYLDKKDRIRAWFSSAHRLAVAAGIILLLALPIFRDSVSGRFVLEPLQIEVSRARVPGTVTDVFVEEGQHVAAGTPLAALRNLVLQSDYEQTRAKASMAAERAKAASLHYVDYGSTLKEHEHLVSELQQLSLKNSELQLSSPISGVVITPRVQNLRGSYVAEGQEILRVADLSSLRARIYISEYELSRVQDSASAMLEVGGTLKKWRAQIVSIAPRPTEMDPNLQGSGNLKGTNPPHFYLVDLIVVNPDSTLKPGMTGYARVYGQRRSAFDAARRSITNFLGRKLW
jgi:putative peptide zinc metalloprotease protein